MSNNKLIKDLIEEGGFDMYSVQESVEILSPFKQEHFDLMMKTYYDLPFNYYKKFPPQSFSHIKSKIKHTVINGEMEEIEFYFKSYYSDKSENVLSKIYKYKENLDNVSLCEMLSALQSILDRIIIDNMAISYIKETFPEPSEKELLETKLFGIWSPYHIIKQRIMINGDKKLNTIIQKAAKVEKGNRYDRGNGRGRLCSSENKRRVGKRKGERQL